MEINRIDEWAKENIRELQHGVNELQEKVRGRLGETNGGGLVGAVKRIEKEITALDKSLTRQQYLILLLVVIDVLLFFMIVAVFTLVR